jgi:chromosome segregation ATPase
MAARQPLVEQPEEITDPTEQVLALRNRLDTAKTRLTEIRTKISGAEDQLAAADDAIRRLGLDPDRDLARQVSRLLQEIEGDLIKVEGQLDEADTVLANH